MQHSTLRHILLIVNDSLGSKMAGPAIRYWELARVLSRYAAVTLAVPPVVPLSSPLPPPDFAAEIVLCRTKADLRAVAEQAEVIITLGGLVAQYPFLAKLGKPLVLDLYDPFLLAGLHKFADYPLADRLALNERYIHTLRFQLSAADFMMCASEKQRDYWLGMLSVLGRVNPFTGDDDPTLHRLIDVVPFGLPSQPPQHTQSVLKGVYKTIAPHDKVLLWGGGIWNWFDAPTLIRAMALITQQRADVKLFFMGIKHPNAAMPKMFAVDQAIALSRELGLYDRFVFFNEWTPYADRQNYLLEADIGVSLHLDHAETRFAFRTRLLDYVWASLPIIATTGDVLSDMVQAGDLGRVVKPGDVAGVAQAVLDLLNTPDLRQTYQPRFEQAASMYRWEEVARPLIDFCVNPRLAPDKPYLNAGWPAKWLMQWGDLSQKAWQTVRRSGSGSLGRKVRDYLKWKFNRD